MGAPTFGADRVLVTTASTGNGALVLGNAVPGFHDPGLAGLVSGRRYSFASLDAVGTGGAATNWDRGVGLLTEQGGVWTLARSLVRKNKAGGTSPVNWGAGPKFVVLGIAADDVAMLDSVGWLGLGGDPMRERLAPLDVVAEPNGPGLLVRAGTGQNGALENVFSASRDGSRFEKPVSGLNATDPAHLMRKDQADALPVARGKTVPANYLASPFAVPFGQQADLAAGQIAVAARRIDIKGIARVEQATAGQNTVFVGAQLRGPDQGANPYVPGVLIQDLGNLGLCTMIGPGWWTFPFVGGFEFDPLPPNAQIRLGIYKELNGGTVNLHQLISTTLVFW